MFKTATLPAGILALTLAVTVMSANAAPACCPKSGAGCAAKAQCPTKSQCWMLSIQAWTFHHDTLFEAIDKASQLGIENIELFPNQKVSPEDQVKFDQNASVSLIVKVKNKLDQAGVKAVAFGVTHFGKTEADCRKTFDFAKLMGITTITAEPAAELMPMIDKLANEYSINVALHNHPKAPHSKYWSPESVLKAIAGCSKRMGACADTGHWVRSGLDPMECLKKLEGRILWSHFKDLNEKSREAHDVPWGTGVNDCKALMAEMQRQGFKGGYSVEYEYNWGKSMPEIAKCVQFFWKTAQELCPVSK